MPGVRNKIVVAQRIWGTDNYIAYYDNGDAMMFDAADEDDKLAAFIEECSTTGCSKTVEFPVQTGAQTKVKCRQTIYCKGLVVGGGTSVSEAAAGLLNSIAKGGLNCVVWCPTFHRLTLYEGVLNTPRPVNLSDLNAAPKAAREFMQQCVKSGYSLCRVYQTTVNNRVTTVEEYLFSAKKLPRDFRGSDTDQITVEELCSWGFEI